MVETSGVAEPEKIMDFARLDPALYSEGIIVLADAAEVTDRVADLQIEAVVRSQLASASLLLLNKVDSVDSQQKDRALQLLAELNDKAPVVQCCNADVPMSLLFAQTRVIAQTPKTFASLTDSTGPAVTGEPARETTEGVDSASPFTSHSFSGKRPLDREEFDRFRSQLPATVLRAKGLFRFAGDGESYLWQRTGKRDELVRWTGQPVAENQLVFIASASAAKIAPLALSAQALFTECVKKSTAGL